MPTHYVISYDQNGRITSMVPANDDNQGDDNVVILTLEEYVSLPTHDMHRLIYRDGEISELDDTFVPPKYSLIKMKQKDQSGSDLIVTINTNTWTYEFNLSTTKIFTRVLSTNPSKVSCDETLMIKLADDENEEEIIIEWKDIIDGFGRKSGRLKNRYNPNKLVAHLPDIYVSSFLTKDEKPKSVVDDELGEINGSLRKIIRTEPSIIRLTCEEKKLRVKITAAYDDLPNYLYLAVTRKGEPDGLITAWLIEVGELINGEMYYKIDSDENDVSEYDVWAPTSISKFFYKG